MPPSWIAQLPAVEAAVSAFPLCADGEPFELCDLRVADAAGGSLQVLSRPELVNVALDRCDVAGFVAREGRAARLALAQSRVRGLSWVAGIVQDAVLDGVTGTDVSLRFSQLRRVLFRDCALPGIDLTEVSFDAVRFERCDLRGAQFDGVRVRELRIEHCDLAGASGISALAGASVHPDDLVSVTTALAEALGLIVESETPTATRGRAR